MADTRSGVCANCGKKWGDHYSSRCYDQPGTTTWRQLADGDHFAGMPVADADEAGYLENLPIGRQAVIQEITDEIDSGDAHLMTRNELKEFMQWWLDQPNERNSNEMNYQAMDQHDGILVAEDVEIVAKAYFVHKGYEHGEGWQGTPEEERAMDVIVKD